MSEEKKENNKSLLERFVPKLYAKWHKIGEQSRIISLFLCFIALFVAMVAVPLIGSSHLKSFSEEAKNNPDAYVGKKLDFSPFVFLSTERSLILSVPEMGKSTHFTATRDNAAINAVKGNLDELKRELLKTDDNAIWTVGWTAEQRTALREKLSDDVLQEWKDIASRGILEKDLGVDEALLLKSKIKVDQDTEELEASKILTADQMADLMAANVDPWDSHQALYRDLFRKIVKPTLVSVKADESKCFYKKVFNSGDMVLNKDNPLKKEDIQLLNAYVESGFFQNLWRVHYLSCIVLIVICLFVFWFFMQNYQGGSIFSSNEKKLNADGKNGTSDDLYPYFPMLALFLGFLCNGLVMYIVVFIEACFPVINHFFPLPYLFAVYPMFLPTLLMSMMYRYDVSISLFTGLFFAVLFSVVSVVGTYSIVFIGFCSSLGCIFFAKKINSVRKLMVYSFWIQIACVAITAFLHWIVGVMQSGKFEIDYFATLVILVIFLGTVMSACIFAPVCMSVMEMFGADTRTIYNELGSMSYPLMSELAEKAPGTFYHCVKVANMAAFAAKKMENDFDPVVIRACAMFHDIGKLMDPKRFMENGEKMRREDYGSYREMAQFIIGHVENGIKMADDNHLPHLMREVISTHHGHSCQDFFLKQAIASGETTEEHYEDFCYPYSNPIEPEAFLIGMADACEAAVNGAKERSKFDSKDSYCQMVKQKVNEIFSGRQKGGFMTNAHVRLDDLSKMRDAFIEHLSGQFKRSNENYDKVKKDEALADNPPTAEPTGKESAKA